MKEREPGDQMEHVQGNEAIPAVADDGSFGEDEDDFEDLYSDVNVGEGFLQYCNKRNEDPGLQDLHGNSEQKMETSVSASAPVVNPSVNTMPGEVVEETGNSNTASISRGNNVNRSAVSAQGSTGQQPPGVGNVENDSEVRNVNVNAGEGSTTLFVSNLLWWTTDAQLEEELCKYGPVKELKFFSERASGKAKGCCQVDFCDPAAAAACRERMNGHAFNRRPCVVTSVPPFRVNRRGEARLNSNQQMGQDAGGQDWRGISDGETAPSWNYQGGDGNRGHGRGNSGRGEALGIGRGPIGPMNRPGEWMAGRGMMGYGGNVFGHGLGSALDLLPPNAMMGRGFDPTFGRYMRGMGSYGSFPGASRPPFSRMLSPFSPVGGVALPGVAPHVYPAFFGRGMPMDRMSTMPSSSVHGPNMGMWPDSNVTSWGGEQHGYGEEATSDQQYREVSHDRGGWQSTGKEMDQASETEWSGSSDRKYQDDRDAGRDRGVSGGKDVSTDHGHGRSERRRSDDRNVGRERAREQDRAKERSQDQERKRERERDQDRDRYREHRDRYAEHRKYKEHEAQDDEKRDRVRSSKSRRSHSR